MRCGVDSLLEGGSSFHFHVRADVGLETDCSRPSDPAHFFHLLNRVVPPRARHFRRIFFDRPRHGSLAAVVGTALLPVLFPPPSTRHPSRPCHRRRWPEHCVWNVFSIKTLLECAVLRTGAPSMGAFVSGAWVSGTPTRKAGRPGWRSSKVGDGRADSCRAVATTYFRGAKGDDCGRRPIGGAPPGQGGRMPGTITKRVDVDLRRLLPLFAEKEEPEASDPRLPLRPLRESAAVLRVGTWAFRCGP